MRDRDFQYLSLRGSLGKWCRRVLHANVNVAANISQTDITHHRTGKKACFQKNLKAITNPKNEAAALRKMFHRLHPRGKPRKRPSAKIIAVRKTPRQNDRIAIR